MTTNTALTQNLDKSHQASELPETFLSCYEIVNQNALRWGVRLYKVRRDGGGQTHAERGETGQVIWSLWEKNKQLCRGYGFVVDVDEETVAVPAAWKLPSDVREGEYLITFDSEFTTDPANRSHRAIIAGILRDGLKKHFKDNRSDILGDGGRIITVSVKCRSTATTPTFISAGDSARPPNSLSGTGG